MPNVWHRASGQCAFCHNCGSPVNDTAARAEYKQVTVLFADVVGSMDIAAAVGAERLRVIMADLVDRATAVVQRYGGTVDKFTGDGLMAVFGAPAALEDHAVRACLAALGIQQEPSAWRRKSTTATVSTCGCGWASIPVKSSPVRSVRALWVTPPWGSRWGWHSGWKRSRHRAGWC